jgi:parvulin-like peptidyl-prolyl isomerase
MGRIRRITTAGGMLILLAVVAMGCSGCKSKSSAPVADAGVTTSGALTPEQAAQVLARVGDHTITLGEFEAALEHMDQFDRMRYQSPERRKELLGEMIDVALLADEAHDKGYDKDPVTQQELREILRDAMLKKAREGVPAPNELPVEEVRAYYDAHRADFHDPERRRVSAVVLTTEAAAAAALETARKASAAQWGELVRAKSTDAMAKSNTPLDMAGDFGFVSPPGDPRGANARVPEEVRAGVFEVEKVGDVLPRVVRSGGKYYVVKLTSRTDAHDRTFEEAERQIRVKLAQDKIHAREEALLDELRKRYPVKIDDTALAQVNVQLPGVDAGADAR